jgi:HAD superfamily hydrolase (TIGR01509 family)
MASDRRFGVLWDMDGVLVDTGPTHYRSWVQALAEHGLSMDEDFFRATFGMTNATLLPLLLGERSIPELVQRIGDRKEALFRAMMAGQAKPLPGVEHWLRSQRAAGGRQAVASSAPPENIDILLGGLGLRPWFDAVVSGDGLPGKPAPDVFLKAARAIDTPPERCLVIEDAINGVAGAKNAGMKCIAVTTTNPAPALALADIVVESLAELSPSIVNRLLGV